MDAVTIYFVRHLAYADMVLVLIFGIPIFLVHLLDGWKFGKMACTITAYAFAVLPTASLSFTAWVGLHRLLRCTIPQKLHVLQRRHVVIIAWATWVLTMTPGIAKIIHRPKAIFLDYWATCYFDLVHEEYPAALTAISSIFITIPSFVIVASNISIIVLSLRLQKQSRNPKQARGNGSNKMVYAISILYFVAWVPYITSEYLHHPKQLLPNWAHNFLNHSFLLQNVGNPIIYMIVNRNFYKFIAKLLKKYFPCCQWMVKSKKNTNGKALGNTQGINTQSTKGSNQTSKDTSQKNGKTSKIHFSSGNRSPSNGASNVSFGAVSYHKPSLASETRGLPTLDDATRNGCDIIDII